MKKSIRLAAAFLALAGVAAGPAFAIERDGKHGDNRRDTRFERADADSGGDVTFEEFAAAMNKRVGKADVNGDGKMTVAEIASEIERMRAERMARRIVERFDTNGDGVLTTAEIEARQKKMFALMDRNNDGKLVKGEMSRQDGRPDGRKN